MKNIQAQYQDLLEGRMTKANFMRNVRMGFPQFVSPTTSYDDSVKILKGKRILSENISELSPQTRYNAGIKAGEKVYKSDNPSDSGRRKAISQGNKFLTQIDPTIKNAVESFAKSLDMKVEMRKKTKGDKYEPYVEIFMGQDLNNPKIIAYIYKDKDDIEGYFPDEAAERKFANLVKQIQKKELDIELKKDKKEPEPTMGKEPGLAKSLGINLENSLNEDKKPIGVYGHNPNAENDLYRGIDHVNYYQAYKGIQFELAKEKEITDETYVRVREKVVKNILKDPDAYKDLQLFNFKAVKKMDKDLEMKEVKPDNHVDKANEMKVVKKDAPASANEVKKDGKKKEKVAQMTQAPKSQKGVEAFPTPGKEKIMALREHLLEDLTTGNDTYEEIGKGSRVKKKDLTSYDENGVGNVEDFDGHTALVKWDSGEVEHVQKNVLTKKNIPQHPEAADKFGKIPDSPFMKKEEEESKGTDEASLLEKIKQKLFKAIDKLKKEGSVITTQSGQTIGSDRNDTAAFNKARDLERNTGDQLQVVNTKTGAKRQV